MICYVLYVVCCVIHDVPRLLYVDRCLLFVVWCVLRVGVRCALCVVCMWCVLLSVVCCSLCVVCCCLFVVGCL